MKETLQPQTGPQTETPTVSIKLAQVEGQVWAYLRGKQTYLTVIYEGEEYRLSHDPDSELLMIQREKSQKFVQGHRAYTVKLTQEAVEMLELDTSPFIEGETDPAEFIEEEDLQVLVESRILEIGQYLRSEQGALTASLGEHTGLPLRLDPNGEYIHVGVPTRGDGVNWKIVKAGQGIALDPESAILIGEFSHNMEMASVPRPSRIFTEIGGVMRQVSTVVDDPEVPAVAVESPEEPSALNIPTIQRKLRILEEELDGITTHPIEYSDRLRLFTELEDAGCALKCVFDELAHHGFTILNNSPHSSSPNVLLYGDHQGQVYRLIERIIKMLNGRKKFSRFLCKCASGSRLSLLLEIDKGMHGDSLESVDTASIIAA